MSEAHGHPIPDSAETDPAALSSSEDLDEDRLGVDPLEEGVEPPERYAHSNGFGVTPNEVFEGESIGERLRQERPDIQPEGVSGRPIAASEPAELDETIDDLPADDEPIVPGKTTRSGRQSALVEADQNADKLGGSVAETIRTPPRQ